MDTKEIEFIQLIDHALEIAEQTRSANQSERLNNVTNVLKTIKSQVIAGELGSSQGTSTLGLAREVADWVESLDSPLLTAVGKIERYYQREYGT